MRNWDKLAAVLYQLVPLFFYRLLKIIEDRSDVVDTHLSVLLNENLIKEKTADPELAYYFYHDLIKDAVYETILLKERKELHRNSNAGCQRSAG